jgi:hypothetical protein
MPDGRRKSSRAGAANIQFTLLLICCILCLLGVQFFAAARVAPTPLQPKGLTREFVLPLEVPCSGSGSSSSSSSTGRNNSTAVFFRPTPDKDSGAGNERGMRAADSSSGGGGSGSDRQDGSTPSSKRSTDSSSGGQGNGTKGSIRGSPAADAAVAEQDARPANAAD